MGIEISDTQLHIRITFSLLKSLTKYLSLHPPLPPGPIPAKPLYTNFP